MYRFFRPIFFIFAPETIHRIVMLMLSVLQFVPWGKSIVRTLCSYRHKSLEVNVLGIDFPNPVGLAAGFDKNAELTDELSCLGFGYVEVGSVTPLAQRGNPKPRNFRLPKDMAIINRMGFNNKGVEVVAANLRRRNPKLIVGANIGKNTLTPNDNAPEDYEKCFAMLYPHADYFVVNVSCPNVSCLRELQDSARLTAIVRRLTACRALQPQRKPILLKLSPDLTIPQIDEALAVVASEGLDGVVAANTTTHRDGLQSPKDKVDGIGNGGLSGAPLTQRALEMVRYISGKTQGKLPIIGVGGIMTSQDALNMLRAGASLVQVYTGFIYQGPEFVKKICREIAKK
ncbi:MAG: quinone-dependent dihydroorotate dehydrogenase [Prevotellaceae bacterium]|jgi:dihydroorotate dehydrogenase|nr:quinone-dependent dihydroorotate dehydrogenase [Prevotellaceae bacterium]